MSASSCAHPPKLYMWNLHEPLVLNRSYLPSEDSLVEEDCRLAWVGYKNFKREVRRELKFAEQEYAETQIRNNSNNMGCIWKTIRSFIPKKSFNRKSYSKEDKLVANKFNEYFTSIGQNTIDKILSLANECNYDLTQSSFVLKCYPLSHQFTFRAAECREIEQVVTSMATGKAPGNDKIPLRVM